MARPLGAQNRDKPFRDALRMAIAEAGDDFRPLRRIAEALVAQAMEGDLQAIKEIADRLDGKPAQFTTDSPEAFETFMADDELVASLRADIADHPELLTALKAVKANGKTQH